jgi:hypothetical protein
VTSPACQVVGRFMGMWRGAGSIYGPRWLAAVLATQLCGCGAIDQFSPRAQDYNRATADAKSNQILLNVLRAAYSQPLQFTDVTTVAGTTSINGQLSDSVPLPLNTAARLAARTVSASPSVSLTGGNTVNVANLNTQEFYKGLQAPLATSQVSYYLFSGFYDLNSSELLPLFLSEIRLAEGNGRTSILRNRATSKDSFSRFYSATRQLVRAGLYTEPPEKAKPTNIGPLLDDAEARDPKLLSALIAGASASTGDNSGGGITLVAVRKEENGVKTIKYQLQKSGGGGGDDRFCFLDQRESKELADVITTTPYRSKEHLIHVALFNDRPELPVKIASAQFCGKSGKAPKNATELKFKTRSVEEMFHFLGEIVRTELGLAGSDSASLAIPSSDKPDFRLFHVERRLPIGDEPWAMINGQIFVIAIDVTGQYDASSRVLQLLTDLLALQSSAKNLPAPNLIAITQ